MGVQQRGTLRPFCCDSNFYFAKFVRRSVAVTFLLRKMDEDDEEEAYDFVPDVSEECRRYMDTFHVESNSSAIEHGKQRFHALFEEPDYRHGLQELSREMLNYFSVNRQIPDEYNRKISSMNEIYRIIRKHRRWKFKLFPSGSTVTGLASKGSDLDLTIWMPNARKYFATESEAAFNILRIVRHHLLTDQEISTRLRSVLYVEAKVPVLRIRWKNGLEVDLCCCTDVYVSGIQNSYLIRGFSLWDSRFAPLCMFVKEWSFRNDVKNPKRGGFNSYAIVLLVAHFLQCGVSPPILPNLQKLFPNKYARNCDGEVLSPSVLDFDDKRFSRNCPELEKNTMSLAELFILFLDYYSIFNFGTHYICMRDAAARRRDGGDDSLRISDVFSAFIRDPVDDHNPGRTVRDIEYLQNRFRRTLRLFLPEEEFPSLAKLLCSH